MYGHLDAHEGMGSGKDIFTNAGMGTGIIVPYPLGLHCHPCINQSVKDQLQFCGSYAFILQLCFLLMNYVCRLCAVSKNK